MRHNFNDGKYTVINDNGNLTALRHGEPWGRDLTGDNLVYWMLVEVDTLKAQRDDLLKAAKLGLRAAEGWVKDQLEGTSMFAAAMQELDPIRAAIAKAEAANG